MTAQPLYDVLEATGYLGDGGPAPGVSLEQDARNARRSRNFEPDAMWRGRSSLTVYFKYEPSSPSEDTVAEWRREVWNEGTAPLLWVTCPDKTDIYNGFAKPKGSGDAAAHRIRTFRQTASALDALNLAAGRLAMETDRFWQHSMARKVNRRTSVDRLLLHDIARLERDLLSAGMARSDAQGLIGRSIFAQYLVDRGIVTKDFLAKLADRSALSQVLRERAMAERLFDWLREVFNGDMFPDHSTLEETPHLRRVANFLDATDPDTGQMTLFPYQFEIIPVELISSIYEQFVRSDASASKRDVHYTRLSLVSFVLDEVMNECRGTETVLDLTCGSGVFLVEALRRLVRKRAGDRPVSRALIRKALYEQVFGSDQSEAALRVAAFSLYLTALELDPDPEPPSALTFKPLIGRTLFAGDIWAKRAALDEHVPARKFDVIVGNPPWSYSGPELQERRRRTGMGGSRGASLDFVHRAMDYASERTRFGLVLGAPHFFGRNPNTRRTLRQLMKTLAPVTLVNCSNLRDWLFKPKMPTLVLFAHQRKMVGDANVIATYQVPWTAAGKKSHTFQIGPSDLATIPLDYWLNRPDSLKAVLFGSRYDADFLKRLVKRCQPLEAVLDHFGTKLSTGLTRSKSGGKDATFLHDLPFLKAASGFAPYCVPTDLALFRSPSAKRPRIRSIYVAPLLLVKESLTAKHGGRVAAAVATTDTVFTKAFYGATFGWAHRDAAWLVAGILGSSLVSWFFLMTAADYGLGRNRVKLADVNRLPVPDFDESLKSEPGRRVIELAQAGGPFAEDEWCLLDEAVLDLYSLHADDRIAVRDGLTRAGWQWKEGKGQSMTAAGPAVHVSEYARVFMSVIYRLQRASKKNHIRAEVYDLPEGEAVRVVRFVLNPGHRPPTLEMVPSSGLQELLGQIGDAVNVSLADLAGLHEVQRYGHEEIVVVKPAALRHWLGVCALRDAGRAVADSMGGWRP